MITSKKLQLVKEMIIQMVVYYIIPIFLKKYKVMVIDLSKQQALDADLKTIKQINFTGKLDVDETWTMFFIIE